MVENDILKQHRDILISASKEFICNNTKSLIDDDIINGIITPPLEMMDVVKQRLINIAKNNGVVLNTNNFEKIVNKYKSKLKIEFEKIGKYREEKIIIYLENFKDDKPLNVIKELKKELVKIDKDIKKNSKEFISKLVEEYLINSVDDMIKQENTKFRKEVLKYLKTDYIKQFIDILDMKILVKDTILLNSLKEQIERFVFTKENSHLFD